MRAAFIKCISIYLPEKILDNAKINEEHPEWSVDKISSKTGIYSRHIAGDNEFASDMAVKAAIALFDENNINPQEIDYILFCTQSADYFLPTTACILQDRLNIPTSAGALDFNLGCSGYIYGLSLAKGLIASGVASNVLLLTSETYSKYIHPQDKSSKTIFGDAATASLITTTGSFEIKKFSFGTDGKGSSNLMVTRGGSRYRHTDAIDELNDDGQFVKNENNLFMNGSEIFTFTSKSVPVLVKEVLSKNELEQNDINFFVFHQANKYMLDFIRKKIEIPVEKFIYHIQNVGNTVSSTIPIALKEKCFECEKGKYLLLAGFGVGYSWAGCIIQKAN